MQRTGTARWEGDIKGGKGTLKSERGAVSGTYSFGSRFGADTSGTNPEELIATAHAACFSMALSAALSKDGTVPRSIETTATVNVEQGSSGFAITRIDLDCRADVPGIAADALNRIAEDAKNNCPVSKALSAVPITLNLTRING
ncbi:MAG TPA: OsmC family protein [Gemmatimonadales bacterium]